MTPDSRLPDVTVALRYAPPYDWRSMIAFLKERAICGVEAVDEDAYRRTILINGGTGTLYVRPGARDALEVAVRFPDPAHVPLILDRVGRVFDLAGDPAAVAAHLCADPALEPLVRLRPGLRVPGGFDGLELAIRAVLGQQVSVAAAARLAGKLVLAHGLPLKYPEPGLTHAFPPAEALVGADFAALGMPRSRAAALAALVEASLEDASLFQPRASLAEAVRRLRQIRGIGEWTAQYVALRLLREPDAFPAADVALLRAMERLRAGPWTAKTLLERSESWRPFRANAAQYLWTAA
ncbi:DNA-3-methyladenine glycosylase [Methylocella sp.]|uniref:DNA-3-methyladenine glycosylase family protein n=1 Tax=Methylocella sp. TaxID=1978226 RepID=UPI0035AF803E